MARSRIIVRTVLHPERIVRMVGPVKKVEVAQTRRVVRSLSLHPLVDLAEVYQTFHLLAHMCAIVLM